MKHVLWRLNRGFTLIELMIVVVILAILASMIIPPIMSRPEQARKVKAQTDIMSIQSALDLYKLDNGFYPSTLQNLQALVRAPTTEPKPQNWQAEGYLKSLPIDPWGHPYHYLNPGKHAEVDIWSTHQTNKAGLVVMSNWKEDA